MTIGDLEPLLLEHLGANDQVVVEIGDGGSKSDDAKKGRSMLQRLSA